VCRSASNLKIFQAPFEKFCMHDAGAVLWQVWYVNIIVSFDNYVVKYYCVY